MPAVMSETACTSACSATWPNRVGMPRPITASASIDAFMPATRWLNDCRPFLSPPIKNDAPSTSSVLPRIDPVIDAVATSSCPARMANMVMISSAALPKVAFNTPPILGPALAPSCSVATPTIQASATRAAAETRNTIVLAADASASAPAAAAMITARATEMVSIRLRPRVTARSYPSARWRSAHRDQTRRRDGAQPTAVAVAVIPPAQLVATGAGQRHHPPKTAALPHPGRADGMPAAAGRADLCKHRTAGQRGQGATREQERHPRPERSRRGASPERRDHVDRAAAGDGRPRRLRPQVDRTTIRAARPRPQPQRPAALRAGRAPPLANADRRSALDEHARSGDAALGVAEHAVQDDRPPVPQRPRPRGKCRD